MTIVLFSGSMYSSKTKRLLERLEVSERRKRISKVFYPAMCSNGEINSVYSRVGIRKEAIPIQTILDVYSYMDGLEDIFIDEIQFLNSDEFAEEDFLNFIAYCDKNKINLYLSGLDLDYRGEAFLITKAVMPYCDKIEKLYAVCSKCFKETARRSLRLKNGVPCSFDEEVLIERNNVEYTYIPVCTSCYYREYLNIKRG